MYTRSEASRTLESAGSFLCSKGDMQRAQQVKCGEESTRGRRGTLGNLSLPTFGSARVPWGTDLRREHVRMRARFCTLRSGGDVKYVS